MERLGAPWPGAVAVSGGGDSLALMNLLRDWASAKRLQAPVVLTVDHGLRKGSSSDAARVRRWARDLGLQAHVLAWRGAKPKSDIEAQAREARYALMGAWCRDNGMDTLYIAHTRDDQAETFLLRLARGSGLDGLSAMRPIGTYPLDGYSPLRIARPLIGIAREHLRAELTRRGQDWIEDPMNSDPRFGRVRIRDIAAVLESAGLSMARIADAAAHLGRAREALDHVTAAVLARACRADGDAILLESAALIAAPREVGLRALASVLMAVSGQTYRPRFERLERLYDLIAKDGLGAGRTLHGCRVAPAPAAKAYFGSDTLLIEREAARKPAQKAALRRRARNS